MIMDVLPGAGSISLNESGLAAEAGGRLINALLPPPMAGLAAGAARGPPLNKLQMEDDWNNKV